MTRNRDLGDVAPFVDGVSSNIQTQINAKAPTASPTFTGGVSVTGEARAVQNTTSANLFVAEADMGTHNNRTLVLRSPDTDSASEPFVFNTGNTLSFETDGTERLLIDNDGISVKGGNLNVTAQGSVRMEDAAGGEYAAFQAPTTLTASYIMTMPPNTGSTGQFLQTNGSGVLSFASVAPSGTSNFVASGAISSGNVVGLNPDGTVSVISGYVGGTGDFGDNAGQIASTFDSTNNKIIIAYQNRSGSNYGFAVVGTISGTSISFGTPVAFNSVDIEHTGMSYDSNSERVVIGYRDNGNSSRGTAVVGSVSGTAISFGTPVVFTTNSTDGSIPIAVTFDSSNNKIVIAWSDRTASNHPKAIVGTVNPANNSISFGTETVIASVSGNSLSAAFDSTNNKIVVAYEDGSNTQRGTAAVGAVSGTSISFGTPVVFVDQGIGEGTKCVFVAQGRVFITFVGGALPFYSGGVLGTVIPASNSISFGSAATFLSDTVNHLACTIDPSSGLALVVYSHNNKSYCVQAVISGATFAFGSTIQIFSGAVRGQTVAYDSNSDMFAPVSAPNGAVAVCQIIDGDNLFLNSSFVGIATENISNTATGSVTVVGGVNENVTGLIGGVSYYVQTDGTLGGSSTSTKAGIALGASKLLITSAGS